MTVACGLDCGDCLKGADACWSPKERKARAHQMYIEGIHPNTIMETMHIGKRTLAKWIDEWEGETT